MSGAGREALQMRFHFGERDRDGGGPLHDAVMDACARHGMWAAALLRGVEGFGAGARMRTERLLSLSEDQPLVAVAVGERDDVERLVDEVGLGPTGTATTTAAEVAAPVGGVPGEVVRATLWGPRAGARSPHLRAVEALHRHGADAAMVLVGVDGVLGGERRRARFLAANRDVPAMTVAVGERGAIDGALAEVGALADLVTLEGGARNSAYDRVSRPAATVTLLTSEATQGHAGPLYLEYIDALRRAGAPGATALRGVWGFRGDVAPHGDRVFALRRDVPLSVETVDSVEGSAKWLQIAESLAGEADFAYSRAVGRRFDIG